ncbi:hypothetical protein Msil_2776 [Methylocella silvestris BL2]|uniref:Translation initiation factor IF-2 n=1 Tax=Methylocella silvestris (strain DSM 15510 / CIP 108128 / LMG 27833 / NCIMB 13906 / BL2) TaxID=395965 RepID=B8ERZ7_METSB|nr:hypothetical protein [Methylocella silvestris]ACK51695.1 hypothetical protein Msil_2776 [Methylocella silvestris BL2]
MDDIAAFIAKARAEISTLKRISSAHGFDAARLADHLERVIDQEEQRFKREAANDAPTIPVEKLNSANDE